MCICESMSVVELFAMTVLKLIMSVYIYLLI